MEAGLSRRKPCQERTERWIRGPFQGTVQKALNPDPYLEATLLKHPKTAKSDLDAVSDTWNMFGW